MSSLHSRCAVVALGGNAISPPNEAGLIASQFRATRQSLAGIIHLVRQGYQLALSHGNGPQVGDKLRRVELSRGILPDTPLGVLVADTQGSIGYMIEQSLQNRLHREGINRRVVTIITQVLVDEHDPALKEPTKFIGQSYSLEDAQKYIETEGWTMKEYSPGKWRRVVGSPKPLGIVNRQAIRELVQQGVILIAAGGGGIPVYRDAQLNYEGVDAVIDKDRASAVMAHDIEADELFILTNIDAVRINWGKPDEQVIKRMRIHEARQYIAEGQFPSGSMGPKVEAAVQFVESGGKRAVICALEEIEAALQGQTGTIVSP